MDERVEAGTADDAKREPYEAPEVRKLADVEDATLGGEQGPSDGIAGST